MRFIRLTASRLTFLLTGNVEAFQAGRSLTDLTGRVGLTGLVNLTGLVSLAGQVGLTSLPVTSGT